MASDLPSDEAGESKVTSREDSERQMKVWEQHATVINMPRFDYAAPNSLISRPCSAFLITCPIKREKSATKEAISLINEYFTTCKSAKFSVDKGASADESNTKKRKTLAYGSNACSTSTGGDANNDDAKFSPSLIKLTKNGLLLLVIPDGCPLDPVNVVSDLFQRLETKTLSRPIWCHRIFPVQATCCLREEDLKATVLNLASQFMEKHHKSTAQPIKFAIGYNRRGLEEKPKPRSHINGGNEQTAPFLDRSKCFDTVASAIKEAFPNSSVDLTSPELSVLVEVLPVAGINSHSLAAVSVLPKELVRVKPRLAIRPLLVEEEGNQS